MLILVSDCALLVGITFVKDEMDGTICTNVKGLGIPSRGNKGLCTTRGFLRTLHPLLVPGNNFYNKNN